MEKDALPFAPPELPDPALTVQAGGLVKLAPVTVTWYCPVPVREHDGAPADATPESNAHPLTPLNEPYAIFGHGVVADDGVVIPVSLIQRSALTLPKQIGRAEVNALIAPEGLLTNSVVLPESVMHQLK